MRAGDTKRHDSDAYQSVVSTMRARGEGVHDTAEEVFRRTGGLDPNVDIFGKTRTSRNAMTRAVNTAGAILSEGIALPFFSSADATGSTYHWLEAIFHASERQYMMLGGVRPRYQTQIGTGLVTDRYYVDTMGIPAVQATQFEPDHRSALQVRLLRPPKCGNNTNKENYDWGLLQGLFVSADIWEFYGLKGYFNLVADDIGDGYVTARDVKKYLGQEMDEERMQTTEICRRLLERWHLFVFQIPSGQGMLSYSSSWWPEQVGPGRLIKVPDPNLLAEARAGLVYVTETEKPTEGGFIKFLRSGGEDGIVSESDAKMVWKWLQAAEQHFGAQTRLPGYNEIPLPGDLFAHYRDPWPIGHPREKENPSYQTLVGNRVDWAQA